MLTRSYGSDIMDGRKVDREDEILSTVCIEVVLAKEPGV
jgi:hypothetical protein